MRSVSGWRVFLVMLGLVLICLCACGSESACGPGAGVVSRVVDGDTLVLQSGERVRYLLVDTPETTNGKHECFGSEARDFNRSLVEGRNVRLEYGEACTDRYGRLLAYVSVDGREVNSLLAEGGYACVLYVSPAGRSRRAEFEALESSARQAGRGMWGTCSAVPCAR
ncbi:thermonuclease family protein [Vitiosangium sp. GDMCC 1.1324]|uniref:thermonuclease family protein n=1 Tax=Vitiosangium sp. (strain GDMCC 1.1324) TaxID=2138576 RepID=UPI001E4D4188|nr:thermonuclease family protein [Vitiosangium sp. GDMCC 1.1324]